jgi:hypothetical protein
VLSVVAQQVLTIVRAKAAKVASFVFEGACVCVFHGGLGEVAGGARFVAEGACTPSQSCLCVS